MNIKENQLLKMFTYNHTTLKEKEAANVRNVHYAAISSLCNKFPFFILKFITNLTMLCVRLC